MVSEIPVVISALILWYYSIIPTSAFLVFLYITYWLPKWLLLPIFQYLFPEVRVRNSHSQQIALTFDDVPNGAHEDILKILDKYDFKSTLFVISGQVTPHNRHILVSAVKKGHQLGNHGKTNSMHWLKSEIDLKIEIDNCDKLIKEIYEEANIKLPAKMVYRPGSGLFTSMMQRIVKSYGYILVLGSVYPNDCIMISSWLNAVYLENHIERGDIPILHDKSWTPATLERVCKWMKFNMIKSVTLDTFL